MPNDVADWTSAVIVQSGTVAISGTATVAISGTPAVSISGTASVSVANTPVVTISGTPTVAIAAAQTIGISGTPTVAIAAAQTIGISGTTSVTFPSAQAVTVSGTASVTFPSAQAVTISGTPTVNIAAAQTIGISGTVSVTFPSAQAVSITGTPSVSIAGTPAVTISGSPTVNIGTGAANVTATGALGAPSARVQIALQGMQGVGLQVAVGTLVGTLTPEVSFDGGTNWKATRFYDPTANNTLATQAINSTTFTGSIMVASGATHARVHVSAYTSGTSDATLTATTAAITPIVISGTPAVTISGTTTVTISGTATVAFAAGQTVSITGTPTVNIGSSGSVSITGGTINVQTAAGVSVQTVTPSVTIATLSQAAATSAALTLPAGTIAVCVQWPSSASFSASAGNTKLTGVQSGTDYFSSPSPFFASTQLLDGFIAYVSPQDTTVTVTTNFSAATSVRVSAYLVPVTASAVAVVGVPSSAAVVVEEKADTTSALFLNNAIGAGAQLNLDTLTRNIRQVQLGYVSSSGAGGWAITAFSGAAQVWWTGVISGAGSGAFPSEDAHRSPSVSGFHLNSGPSGTVYGNVIYDMDA